MWRQLQAIYKPSHLSKQPASLTPNNTKSLPSTSAMQSSLYIAQEEMAH